jgi:hypothetical protein
MKRIPPSTHCRLGEGHTIAVIGDLLRPVVVGDETDGRYGMWEPLVVPGGGLRPHLRCRDEGGFRILEGEITFHLNSQSLVVTEVCSPIVRSEKSTRSRMKMTARIECSSLSDPPVFRTGFRTMVDRSRWGPRIRRRGPRSGRVIRGRGRLWKRNSTVQGLNACPGIIRRRGSIRFVNSRFQQSQFKPLRKPDFIRPTVRRDQ